MKTNNSSLFLDFALQTAKKTGETLLSNFNKTYLVSRGTAKEVKSYYDNLADKLIIKAIEKNFPNHSYLTEESGFIQKDPDYLWIIDPIDGTANFVNHNPFFAISIALWIKKQPFLGVLEAPKLAESFVAIRGKGAFIIEDKTNRKITAKVSEIKELSQSYLVYCDGGSPKKAEIGDFVKIYYPKTKDMRKLGSAALELAWVGTGRADAYITPEISIWDIAAGVLFVKEAGGEIKNFQNKPYKWPDLLKLKKIALMATNKNIPIINY